MTHELAGMTTVELKEAIAAGLITIEQAMEEIDRRTAQKESELAAAKAAAKGGGRTIKSNNAGGLFIRDSSFKAWSEDKAKEYTGCLNMDPDIARALVNNAGLLDDIREYLQSSGLTKFPKTRTAKKPEPVAQTEPAQTVAAQLTAPGPLASKVKK